MLNYFLSKLAVGGKSYILLLDSGINPDLLDLPANYVFSKQVDALLEYLLHSLFSDPFSEVYKITRIKWVFVLELNLTIPTSREQQGLSIYLSITVSSPRFYICFSNRSPTVVLIDIDGLPTSPYEGAKPFLSNSKSIFFASKQSSCCGFIKLVRTVLNISNCG
jgi:hypothetical protein